MDIVEVDRIKRAIEETPSFLRRVFTPAEIAWCERYRSPAPHYAARFAAKEAAFKALGGKSGALRFLDYEVEMEGERPVLRIKGKTKEELGEANVLRFSLSLSHEKGYAIAVVLVSFEGEDS